MLNKEQLLMGEHSDNATLFVERGDFTYAQVHYGYMEHPRLGELNKIPYWLSPYYYMNNLFTDVSSDGVERATFGIGGGSELTYEVTVTILQNGVSITKPIGKEKVVLFSNALKLDELVGQEVTLIFDPPRWLLGSRDTRTNRVRRGVPWEVLDAEQGTSDRWCRGVVDSAVCVHWGFLYKTGIAGFRRAPSLEWISANRYLNVSRTSESSEFATALLFCWGTRIHKRRWVYSRLLQQARDRNFSASKQGVSRNKLRSVTSKEALYA